MWEVDHIKHVGEGGVVFGFTKIGTYAVCLRRPSSVSTASYELASILLSTPHHRLRSIRTTHAHARARLPSLACRRPVLLSPVRALVLVLS